jgi:rubredoxin
MSIKLYCRFCNVELTKVEKCEPFSMNTVIGQELEVILRYFVCPKCGLMYQPAEMIKHKR